MMVKAENKVKGTYEEQINSLKEKITQINKQMLDVRKECENIRNDKIKKENDINDIRSKHATEISSKDEVLRTYKAKIDKMKLEMEKSNKGDEKDKYNEIIDKKNEIIGEHFDEAKELLKKINRIRDLIKNQKWFRLRCIMHCKERNEDKIKIVVEEKLKYMIYLLNVIKERRKFNEEKRERIGNNNISFTTNKRIKKRKQTSNEEFPDDQSTLDFWKMLYEKETNVDQNNWRINEICKWNEGYRNYDEVTISENERKDV